MLVFLLSRLPVCEILQKIKIMSYRYLAFLVLATPVVSGSSVELELVLDSLLKAVSQLKQKSEFNVSDFSDLQSLCNEIPDEQQRCNVTVELVMRSLKFINDREPKSSTEYYHFIIIGLLALKFIIVAVFSYAARWYVKRHKRLKGESGARDSTVGDSSVPPYRDIEMRSDAVYKPTTTTLIRESEIYKPIAKPTETVDASGESSDVTSENSKLLRKNIAKSNDKIVVRRSSP